MIAVNEVE